MLRCLSREERSPGRMGRKQLAQPGLPHPNQLTTAPTGTGGRPSSAPGAEFKHKLEEQLRKCTLSAFPLEAIFQAAVNRKSTPLTASSISIRGLFPYR